MENILDSHEGMAQEERQYALASKGKRFVNYLIDSIGYLLFSAFIGILIGLFAVETGNDHIFDEPADTDIASIITEYLLGFILIITYYTILEYAFKGKTLGKLITGTRAIMMDNSKMKFGAILKRSACRVIPFEAFSFLGDDVRGWHDSLSDTKVILDENWSEEIFV